MYSMEIPRYWRLEQQRYGLVGEVCPHCDAKIFPPRDICLYCGGDTLHQKMVENLGMGKVSEITSVNQKGKSGEESIDYTVATVSLRLGAEVKTIFVGNPTTVFKGSLVRVESRLFDPNTDSRVLISTEPNLTN